MWTINYFIINIASIGPSEATGTKPTTNIGIIVGSIIGIVIFIVIIAGTCLLLMCCLLYNMLLVLTVIGIVCYRKNKNKVGSKENVNGSNPSSKL